MLGIVRKTSGGAGEATFSTLRIIAEFVVEA
jgi:hypothetical protein